MNTNAKSWPVIHGLFLTLIFESFLFFAYFEAKPVMGGKGFFKVKGGGWQAIFEAPRRGGIGFLKVKSSIPEIDFCDSIAWSLINWGVKSEEL